MKKSILICLFLLSFALTGIKAQQTTGATGGNASGSGGTVSYSIGQIVYTTNFGTNGSNAQGVQQPYEISVVTSIEQADNIQLQCSAFPNPTTDYLTLKTESYKKDLLFYELYDINGKLLAKEKIKSIETKIKMNDYATANYYLKVSNINEVVKTFKVIKN